MDYLYPQSINIDAVSIHNVIILPNKLAGDLYFDNIYDSFIDIFVYTCDEEYPLDLRLKTKIKKELEENENLNIVVFGAKHILTKKIKSNKLLIMDDLVLADYGINQINTMNALNLDENKVSHIIKSFCSQDKKLKIGNNLDTVLNYKEYDPSKFNIFYSLISGKDVPQ